MVFPVYISGPSFNSTGGEYFVFLMHCTALLSFLLNDIIKAKHVFKKRNKHTCYIGPIWGTVWFKSTSSFVFCQLVMPETIFNEITTLTSQATLMQSCENIQTGVHQGCTLSPIQVVIWLWGEHSVRKTQNCVSAFWRWRSSVSLSVKQLEWESATPSLRPCGKRWIAPSGSGVVCGPKWRSSSILGSCSQVMG